MNNNYNYNQQPMNNMNQNIGYNNQQPVNDNMNMNQGYSQQPMNQPANYNMNYGYVQPKPPFKFPKIAKDLASILGYIGALIMAIGSFLPFATLKVKLNGESVLDESINYFITDGQVKDGMIILILALVALGLIHFRKNLFALIPTGIASILLIADITDMNSRIQELEEIYEGYGSWLKYDINTSFGPAPFIVGIGIVLIIAHAIIYFVNKNKSKQQQMMNNGMYNQPVNNMNQNMNYNQQPMNNMNQNMNYNNQPMNNMNQNMNYNQQPMNNMNQGYNVPNNQYPNNNM